MSTSDLQPGGWKFETWLKQTFFPTYFCLSPLLKAYEKSSRWLWKESSVSTGVRKPGNTCASPTNMTLAIKVAHPNTTNQPLTFNVFYFQTQEAFKLRDVTEDVKVIIKCVQDLTSKRNSDYTLIHFTEMFKGM